MARLFPVGEYPPTDQEMVILRVLKSRPHHGWTLEELLDELSKGRAKPMSYSALSVHMTHLRRKGYAIKRQVVYSIGGLQLPQSVSDPAADDPKSTENASRAERRTRSARPRQS